jgi:hypothetical protein
VFLGASGASHENARVPFIRLSTMVQARGGDGAAGRPRGARETSGRSGQIQANSDTVLMVDAEVRCGAIQIARTLVADFADRNAKLTEEKAKLTDKCANAFDALEKEHTEGEFAISKTEWFSARIPPPDRRKRRGDCRAEIKV